MTCRGCLSTFPLPADPEWAYAVNTLCRNAVRYQGMLPVIQALAQLEDFPPRAMFVWFPCQNAYEDTEGKEPLTDLDIVCFREGKFVIGQVKSDPAAPPSGAERSTGSHGGERHASSSQLVLTGAFSRPPAQ